MIDRSGSMSGTRIANAKMAIEGFLMLCTAMIVVLLLGLRSSASVYIGFTSDKETGYEYKLEKEKVTSHYVKDNR